MQSTLPERMHTRFTELVNIRFPIVQGGLSHLSYAELAAAVSNAGGLGQIGCACFSTPEELRADIQKAKRLTKLPIGVNFPIGHIPLEAFVDAALAEEPAVITTTKITPFVFDNLKVAHTHKDLPLKKESSENGGRAVEFRVGKLTEGRTDFALKGGT